MKAFLTILVFTIFSYLQSDEITQKDLIGKWEIVDVKMNNPLYCGPRNYKSMIGSTLEFTNDGILKFISKDGIENSNPNKPILWRFEDDQLIFIFNEIKEPQVSEITKEGDVYSFQLISMVELGIKKE